MNEDVLKSVKKFEMLIKRREKIMNYNNTCILETSIFYENFFLFYIIKKLFLNENFEKNRKMYKFICERMTFSDRYEIIKEFAKNKDIKSVSNSDFEFFIKMRNMIAHNLSGISNYDIINEEALVNFGGETITWKEYLEKIKKWADISYKIAEFTKNVYHSMNDVEFGAIILLKYCECNKDYVMMRYNLLVEEPKGECTRIAIGNMDAEILQYMNEENSEVQ